MSQGTRPFSQLLRSSRRRPTTGTRSATGKCSWGGDVLREMDAMRSFLHDALYSGPPWIRSNAVHYPTASLDPRDIEPKATEVAAPFVRHGRQVLWGRDEPRARSVAVARLDAPRHRVVIDASASPLMGSEQRSRASSLPVRRDPAPHRAVDAVTPARRERRAAARAPCTRRGQRCEDFDDVAVALVDGHDVTLGRDAERQIWRAASGRDGYAIDRIRTK